MTLLSALRATKVFVLAAALVTGGMTAAHAGDGLRHRHHHNHGGHGGLKTISRLDTDASRGGFGTRLRYHGDGGRRAADPDFYAGGIVAYRDGGSGLYFYVEDDGGYRWSARPAERRASGPKIITLSPGHNDCAWEAGVCVIRPGR
ncbi:hypothetical protein [Shinella oryzae]|uniref:Uncharacterized protein n=1 Tax=Shinella oryzae TaxID=2871820 RepID=A0ABY9K4P3_9HYPH|nr:hypothetical protein [Shinella oryzae]WLS03553.1 hypothetical protein Q9315_02645 [Shinella oryzae]